MARIQVILGLLVVLTGVLLVHSAPNVEVKALVGTEIGLPCHVDTDSCGELHSVKFYREASRIFVYSQVGGISRGEGDAMKRMNVEYTPKSTYARLIIKSVEIQDEASYKCEITYLEVRENCDVVQIIKLSTLVKPDAVRILQANGEPLNNSSSLGPYNEGTDVELTCEAHGGRPIPKVTWYNNTDIIKSAYKGIDTGDGTGTGIAKLQITLTRGDLNKEFKCLVESDALDESIMSKVIADVNVKPTSIALSGVKDHVVQGTNVKLVCEVTGAKPAAEVKWFNESNAISESLISTSSAAKTDGTFTTKSAMEFTATRWENGNAFHCYADNLVIRDQQESSLQSMMLIEVYYPPLVTISPPVITANETDEYVLLKCSYHSNPMKLEDALWSKDGKNLTLSADKYEGGSVENLPLIIKHVDREDSGNYSCFCKNSVGSQESDDYIVLDVQFPPTVELEIFSPMPVKATEEKNVTLACTVAQGNPSTLSKVRWFLGEELLKELPECNYSSYDENGKGEGYGGPFCSIDSHILSLVNVSESFAGNYTCQGQNIAGWGPNSEPQELIVYYPPSAASLKAIPQKVVKKNVVTLLCSVDNPGRPENITYVWYRGNHHISDITTANWTINPVTFETKSNYTCYASNEGGSGAAASVFVNVTAPPAFIQNLQPYQGMIYTATNISLTCRVECSPECSIIWLKNGHEIPTSDVMYSMKVTRHPPDLKKNDFESVESMLIFNMHRWPGEQLDKAAPNSFYTCQSSSNGIGAGINSTIELAVDYPPENLTVSKSVVDVEENHRPETITCGGKGHPTLTYVWKNDQGANISTSNVLSIKTATRSDAGMYICEASNKHGKATNTAYLNVQYAPSCTLQLLDHNGSPSLECTAKANPPEVGFKFQIKGENETIDPSLITQDGTKGYLPIDSSVDTFRMYQCVVNNSVGFGTPCELFVIAGVAPWWKQLFGDNLILVLAVLAGIILIVVLCIIILLICRRKRSNNKLPNQSSIGDKGGLGSVPPGGGMTDPDQDKLFYENLPFHGMQNPPNKPISIISPIVQTNPRNRFAQPALTAFNTSLNLPGQQSMERAKIFRNQSFHGFGTGLCNNQIGLPQNIGSRNVLQAPLKKISQQNLQNINFISPLYHPPYDFLGSNGVIQTIKPASVKTIDRVVGRNESKLDIRRTASGINMYDKDKQPDTKPIQIDKTTKQSIGKRSYSSLTLRKHRCYSPTFYSVRCKKHAKRRPIIYAILRSSKTSQQKPTNSQQSKDQIEYENLSDSIQICEQNANGANKRAPKPAPRCKKHKRQDIVYENVSKILSQSLNSSNESSLNEAEVKVSTTEAVVHNSHKKAGNNESVSQPKESGVEIVTSPKSPISNLKLTPTLKVSPNFVKPPIESPKGALNTQLQARLKNFANQTLTTVSTQTTFKEAEKEVRKDEIKDGESPNVPSPKIIRQSNAVNAKPLIVKPQRTVPPKVLGANAKKGVLLASASNQNAFYTLTTSNFKSNVKHPLPQQYSATVPHQKHPKLIPRSLFQEQQISKSKSFSSKNKPKKHFQIPLQKYHSFKFQTAESYFQPIKNIHEENLMRNGYAADVNSVYRESHHNNYNSHHKKDGHKSKGALVIRRPNEYQENIQFQENMQNSVQLQYPQPVLARSSVTKANGIVYADLDITKKNNATTNNTFLESSLSLTKAQHQKSQKPKTEYATLKFNDVGQEIDV